MARHALYAWTHRQGRRCPPEPLDLGSALYSRGDGRMQQRCGGVDGAYLQIVMTKDESAMTTRYHKPMTAAELAAEPDEAIDFNDIPELDDAFWKKATLVDPDRTQLVTLRVKKSVLDAFKAQGKGYQTRMNAVLESYSRSMLGKTGL
jgi:uncharacterized protein (DUF4415 family)